MTAPERAHSGSEQANEQADLRDRIAEALALHLNGPASDGRGWYRTGADRIDCYARADAVMAVVHEWIDQHPSCGCADADRTYAELEAHMQAELDRCDREIKKWQRVADGCERAATLAEKRAEAAEAERDRRDDEIARYRTYARDWEREALTERKRAEAAQRPLTEKAAEVDDKSDVGHATADAWMEEARQMTENRDYWRQRAEAAEERVRDQNGHHA